MDFVSYGEALDGQGDGYVSYKFSQEYTNLNTGSLCQTYYGDLGTVSSIR